MSEENEQLANELHKAIIRKFKKRKAHSAHIDEIWAADLADVQLFSKKNKGIRYLLCVVDLFSRYAFVILLKSKTGSAVVDAFEEILNKTGRKPNNIWVDQGKEFCIKDIKSWLVDRGIGMYSTYNEGKSLIAERFIRTLKNKLYKHMTAVSSDVYYDALDDIVDKYNNTYHNSIKKKPVDVTNNDYEGYVCEFDEKKTFFNVGDKVRISKYKDIFAKGYTPNWTREVLIVRNVKGTMSRTYEIADTNGDGIIGTFYGKELQRTSESIEKPELKIKSKFHARK